MPIFMAVADAMGRRGKMPIAISEPVVKAAMPWLTRFQRHLKAEPSIGVELPAVGVPRSIADDVRLGLDDTAAGDAFGHPPHQCLADEITEAPRISSLSPSTRMRIKPYVSPLSTSRATRVIGRSPTSTRRLCVPPNSPTRPNGGSI